MKGIRGALSRDWWRLSWVWLVDPASRAPPGRRVLFRSSIRVAGLSLALGVGALSLTLAIVSGFDRSLSRSISNALSHINLDTGWQTRADLRVLLGLFPPGVEKVEAYWVSQGLLVGEKGGRGVLIEGRSELSAQPESATAPESASSSDALTLRLGAPLVQYLGVEVGGKVRLLLPGLLRRPIEAQVEDTVQFGMHEVDSRFALMDDAQLRAWAESQDAEAFSRRPGDAQGLRIYFDPRQLDPIDLKKVEAWRSALYERLADTPWMAVVTARTWREQRQNLFGAVDLDRKLLSIVLSLLTIVAAFNVIASLVVLFSERDREMATLVGLGLSRSAFVVWTGTLGLLIGVTASALGLVLGALFGFGLQASPLGDLPAAIYNISRLPLYFDWREQAAVFGFGVLCSWTAALVLGWALARMDVLRVLGHRG